ncbi:hypothetical protein HG560_01035 [Helicobacter pylori]|uniref:Hac prophage II protein n=1 Tax=Helicobacter pylori TaxID=210 RepID=A0AAE7P7V1_HELPX|nr:hypothetical protein [Helicobacter pylori]AFI00436.1 hypothetical protein HPSH112_01015 [Helicobacter pylori Shi112]QQW93175.1 hypothetical protein HG560_01035 [Helicobacter pylori]QQX50543.1 hypothetical protein HG562_01040 [Helicobacter pylori]
MSKKETNMEIFQYLAYQTIKESNTDLSFFDFIQKLEKLQKTHTIRSSVCNVRNKRVTSYSILLQKKAV